MAPFAGDLFPPARSIRIGLQVEFCNERAALGLKRATHLFEAELEFERRAADVRADAERARRALLEREIEELDAWHRSPVFVATLAVVATLGAVTVIGYTWGQMGR